MYQTKEMTPNETDLLERLPDLTEVTPVFQPIVHIHTGLLFGVEAGLHHCRQAGLEKKADRPDPDREKDIHHQVDLCLQEMIFTAFFRFKRAHPFKLFYHLDHRISRSPDYLLDRTLELLIRQGQAPADICFELPVHWNRERDRRLFDISDRYRTRGFRTMLTHFDIRSCGLDYLDKLTPDYIRIDRRLFSEMKQHPEKKQILSFLITYSHLKECRVLACDVQNEEEYTACREMGCDLVQGNLVQAPQQTLTSVRHRYDTIGQLAKTDRRVHVSRDRALISGEIRYLEPVFSDCTVVQIFDQFRNHPASSFFPVVSRNGEPRGIIRETAFKEYTFSRFGRQLLENPSFGKTISRFIAKIPVADVHSSVENLIETYTRYNNNEGLIMVENMQYVGVLSTNSLLKLINEKNLTLARNQNPLTQLPGNTLIHEYVSQSLVDAKNVHHLVYFDFDHFKPFNDRYGFRNGDRLILMFAEMLKKTAFSENRFVGHVGGDDFFMGISSSNLETVESQMAALARDFKKNAESFYDPDTVKNGFLPACDRQGKQQELPLMTVSVAILELPAGSKTHLTVEDTANILARLKKKAKQSVTGMASATLDNKPPGTVLPGESA
ncbi:MAG: GGDEF domain-containing protein [Desulfotignum sp.]